MEKKLNLTVIVATFNRAKLLQTTLEALTKQSRSADEIIIVDNNSSDNTREVALSFEKTLPIKYFFEGRQGVAIARNTGLRHASGDIIAFTDDDCVPDADWLKYLEIPFLRDPAIGMVAGSILPFDENSNLIERYSHADHLAYNGVES